MSKPGSTNKTLNKKAEKRKRKNPIIDLHVLTTSLANYVADSVSIHEICKSMLGLTPEEKVALSATTQYLAYLIRKSRSLDKKSTT